MRASKKAAAIRALERDGAVDPYELIEAARAPAHPCHKDFTWDIQQAAEERWYDQARAVIRSLKFRVLEDETVTADVAQYVPSPEQDALFVSLPKVRSKSKVSAILLAEVSMLHGMAARVYGVALSKQGIVGNGVVSQLRVIRDELDAMKTDMQE